MLSLTVVPYHFSTFLVSARICSEEKGAVATVGLGRAGILDQLAYGIISENTCCAISKDEVGIGELAVATAGAVYGL